MRKQKAPLRDFFREYNHTKIRSLILSFMFAFLLSVSFVMITQDVDTRGLMASVSNVANEKHYDADLVLESQTHGMIDVVFGATAQKVDVLTFTLLGDPETLTSLVSTDARVRIENMAPGAYMITMALGGENIYPGTKLMSLQSSMSTVVHVALVDTVFESAGLKYNISSKGM